VSREGRAEGDGFRGTIASAALLAPGGCQRMTGSDMTREAVVEVLSGDLVEISLIPRISRTAARGQVVRAT
jgi:hypothetical protein